MAQTSKLLDVVALIVDLPAYNRWRGQVGPVVERLAGGTAFEVECSAREGRTYESLGLRAEQLMVLPYEPVATPPSSEASASESAPPEPSRRSRGEIGGHSRAWRGRLSPTRACSLLGTASARASLPLFPEADA